MPLSFIQKRKIARSCSKYTATNYANLRPTLTTTLPLVRPQNSLSV